MPLPAFNPLLSLHSDISIIPAWKLPSTRQERDLHAFPNDLPSDVLGEFKFVNNMIEYEFRGGFDAHKSITEAQTAVQAIYDKYQ